MTVEITFVEHRIPAGYFCTGCPWLHDNPRNNPNLAGSPVTCGIFHEPVGFSKEDWQHTKVTRCSSGLCGTGRAYLHKPPVAP